MTTKQSPFQTLVTFRNSQGEAARGTLLKLERATAVFEVYNPYSIVQLSEVLSELTIRRGDRVIYRGRAVVSNLVNTGLMIIVSGTLVDPWGDLGGLLGDASAVRLETSHFVGEWQAESDLDPGYLLAVTEIRGFLSELNRWLGQLEFHRPADQPGHVVPDDAFQEMASVLFPKLYSLFSKFEEEAAKVADDKVVYHKQYAQRDLHPLLMTAPFVHRTFSKPLGYAGDFEMVNMMVSTDRVGQTTYAQLINALHLRTGVAQAHRNRIAILKQFLETILLKAASSGHVARILNIGCGPAQELQELLAEKPMLFSPAVCAIDLLDFNAETLEYTQSALLKLARDRGVALTLNVHHKSVHFLLKQSLQKANVPEGSASYDLIYCAGLLDYLSDKVCNRLLRLFFDWLSAGGIMLATNVHPSNPNRGAMEHILEWYLIYRSEADMARLVPRVGNSNLFLDETGVNVFLEIAKGLREE